MEPILIVSNYYPPEKGAAANRIGQLALKLRKHGYDVSVACPLANYPKGRIFSQYKGKFTVSENLQGIHVKRLWIYPSVSKNLFKRLLSVFSFAGGLFLYLLFARIPKKVVVQSPPLLLSFLAVLALSMRRRKIILNVSDLWPLAAIELGALRPGSLSHKVSLFFERTIYRKASVILGQSNEILAHVESVVPGKRLHLYRNFPDHGPASDPRETGHRKKIFYAGLLGVAQGVYDLIRNIGLDGCELHIFGDGAEKTQIKKFISENPSKNIVFHGMLDRGELHRMLETFDVALVPLATRIYGSVPSKIFEYAALGLPVLYFGGGEGEEIVTDYNLGWIARVGDYESLNREVSAIAKISPAEMLAMKQNVRKRALAEFNLTAQLGALVAGGVF
jgi:glycosyltransferase involved in cell wall biosynthesis